MSEVRRAYKTELDPNDTQAVKLRQSAGAALAKLRETEETAGR